MSKPHYKVADFDKPKVCGLAVHNATLARQKAIFIEEESKHSFKVNPEAMPYVLWAVMPDCSVLALGCCATAAEFQPLVRKTNLAALAKDYQGAIGFVTASESWGKSRGKVNYQTIAVPAAKKGGAK
jgi:hypothetical protein